MSVVDEIKKKMELKFSNQNSKKFEEIENKAYEDAYYNVCKMFFQRQIISDLVEHGRPPPEMKNPKYIDMLQSQADRLTSKPPFMLITVNVRLEVKLSSLVKKVEKFVKKKTILSYAYCYEVRGKSTGLHAHILVNYDDKPYNFKRGAKNTFKTVCDSNNPQILNFKFVQLDNLKSKYLYIKGQKQSKKLAGVQYSRDYRKTHNLQEIYESIPPLPCRDAEISSVPVVEEIE